MRERLILFSEWHSKSTTREGSIQIGVGFSLGLRAIVFDIENQTVIAITTNCAKEILCVRSGAEEQYVQCGLKGGIGEALYWSLWKLLDAFTKLTINKSIESFALEQRYKGQRALCSLHRHYCRSELIEPQL